MSNVNTDQWNRNSLVMQSGVLAGIHRSLVVKLSRLYELVPPKDSPILDLGCGSGYFIREFYGKGYREIYGIEPDVALTANIPSGIANIRNDKAGEIGFPDGTFDAVFVYGVMHHLKGIEGYVAACDEISRVLKPGGRVFMMEPGRLWVMKMAEIGSGLLAPFSATFLALRKAIEEEREDVYFFIKHHRLIHAWFLDQQYLPLVDRYFLYTWVFTSQKPQ